MLSLLNPLSIGFSTKLKLNRLNKKCISWSSRHPWPSWTQAFTFGGFYFALEESWRIIGTFKNRQTKFHPSRWDTFLGRLKLSSSNFRTPKFDCFNPGAGKLVEAHHITKSWKSGENGRANVSKLEQTEQVGWEWVVVEPDWVSKVFLCQTKKHLSSSGSDRAQLLQRKFQTEKSFESIESLKPLKLSNLPLHNLLKWLWSGLLSLVHLKGVQGCSMLQLWHCGS